MTERLGPQERIYAYFAPEIGERGAYAIALSARDDFSEKLTGGRVQVPAVKWEDAPIGSKVAPLLHLTKHQAQMLFDDLARAGIKPPPEETPIDTEILFLRRLVLELLRGEKP